MTDDPIIPPPLAPEPGDLLTASERDVLHAICRDGDILDDFKARLLGAAYGMPVDAHRAAWLLVPLSPAMLDTLAAFEADDADHEEDEDFEEGGDLEPSLGATNDKNQDKAWRSPTHDLEYDGDGVADPDLEPTLGATNCGNPIIPQTFWATRAPEECEEENEHGEGGGVGDGCADLEPSLGSTEDIDHRKAWERPEVGVIDAEAQGTVDDLESPFPTREEENAQRAAVQEALGQLREITGASTYSAGGQRVRFYRPDEIKTIDGVRIVGVLR